MKKNHIHVSEMWKQLEFKVKFCKFTALKIKKDYTKFWNERRHPVNVEKQKNGGSPPTIWPSSLNAVTLSRLSNIVRMATVKVDQEGYQSTNACHLLFQVSKTSDKISQKINPQKSSKDFEQ